MKTAKAIVVGEEERAILKRMLRSQTIDVSAARRARIVLLAGEGMGDREIARKLDIGRIQVARWRARFAEGGGFGRTCRVADASCASMRRKSCA